MQVDASNIYGDSLTRQFELRLHRDGKMKYQVMCWPTSKNIAQIFYTVIIVWLLFVQVVNGEVYPPTVSDVPVHMVYPEGFPPKQRLVIGQELFGIVPGLTMYATIWLREHNRVCDILKAEHPTWDDEQLFQTARLIIIGEGQVAVLLSNLYFLWHND